MMKNLWKNCQKGVKQCIKVQNFIKLLKMRQKLGKSRENCPTSYKVDKNALKMLKK